MRLGEEDTKTIHFEAESFGEALREAAEWLDEHQDNWPITIASKPHGSEDSTTLIAMTVDYPS